MASGSDQIDVIYCEGNRNGPFKWRARLFVLHRTASARHPSSAVVSRLVGRGMPLHSPSADSPLHDYFQKISVRSLFCIQMVAWKVSHTVSACGFRMFGKSRRWTLLLGSWCWSDNTVPCGNNECHSIRFDSIDWFQFLLLRTIFQPNLFRGTFLIGSTTTISLMPFRTFCQWWQIIMIIHPS